MLEESVSSRSTCSTNPLAGSMEKPTKLGRTFLGRECHHPGLAQVKNICSNSEFLKGQGRIWHKG